MLPKIGHHIRISLVALALIVLESGLTQCWPETIDPLGLISRSMPFLGNKGAQDTESILGWSLFAFAPRFKGEMRATAMLVSLEKGKFSDADKGVSLDFIKDLGFEKQGFLVETMARTQLSRFGLRMYYNAYTKNLNGKKGNLQWPEWRTGVDLDIINCDSLRFGLNMDTLWKEPTFSYFKPASGNELIVWPRPVTIGVYGSYNPSDFDSITPSVEVRFRYPAVSGTLVKELEIAAGVKTPRSSKGSSALRAGWRYTSLEYDVADKQIDITWSSFFAEYVCFF